MLDWLTDSALGFLFAGREGRLVLDMRRPRLAKLAASGGEHFCSREIRENIVGGK